MTTKSRRDNKEQTHAKRSDRVEASDRSLARLVKSPGRRPAPDKFSERTGMKPAEAELLGEFNLHND